VNQPGILLAFLAAVAPAVAQAQVLVPVTVEARTPAGPAVGARVIAGRRRGSRVPSIAPLNASPALVV
jgi:hypothetical protein